MFCFAVSFCYFWETVSSSFCGVLYDNYWLSLRLFILCIFYPIPIIRFLSYIFVDLDSLLLLISSVWFLRSGRNMLLLPSFGYISKEDVFRRVWLILGILGNLNPIYSLCDLMFFLISVIFLESSWLYCSISIDFFSYSLNFSS